MSEESSFLERRRLLRAASVLGACAVGVPLAVGAAEPRRLVLVLGDSLSAEYGLKRGVGWVELMARRLAERKPPAEVVNASISGETTAGGRTRIGPLLHKHRPSLVIVELGGNDALRGLDLTATEANLRAITAAARNAGARVLLLGMMLPPNFGADYGRRFHAIYATVAKAESASLVPFFLDGIADRIEYFQPDRIHPTEQAQPRLFENVWPALVKLL
jgi:acyl-CoA thioesterase-1